MAKQREPGADRSFVVTGGGRGVGRAIVERLLGEQDAVVVLERDPAALTWLETHPASARLVPITGDAADERVAERAADLAQEAGTFSGWVNNAAVFRDASLHTDGSGAVLELIAQNFNPAVVGCGVAVRRFLAQDTLARDTLTQGTGGAIVNVSSHQAQRAVPGALPYATAKAALEGLTRALAVDYGPFGIRVNAVALGSITTERYKAFLAQQEPPEAERLEEEMRLLHPLGRVGQPAEVAAAVAYLLSEDSSFISGVTLPVDGGRAVRGRDPEEH